MVIWGGEFTGTGVKNVHGASYDPALDRWSDVPPAPLVDRRGHDAIWTGSEMIVWGGTTAILPPREIAWDGAAYDPQDKAWRKLPDAPIGPRTGPEVVWTGTEMLVLGGFLDTVDDPLSDGAAYNPVTDQWRVLPPIPEPGQTDAYVKRTSVWAGDALLLWTRTVARTGIAAPVTELMVLDPERGSWTRAPAVEGAPPDVLSPLWTGTEVMVQPVPPVEELGMCPGPDGGGASTEGGLYDPQGKVWRPIKPSRYYLSGSGVWVGGALVGTADLKSQFREPCDRGHGGPGSPRPGEPEPTLPVYEPPGPPERIWAAWSPSTQEWIPLPDPGNRTVQSGDQTIWTGNEILTGRYRFGP
jgi:hypothetical protein